jgi:hypothetical protein
MSCHDLLRMSVVLSSVITLACAAPMTQQGSVSRVDVQNEALKEQQLVIESSVASNTRAQKIALPLLKAARPMCGDHVAGRTGIQFASVAMYPKDWQTAARMAGLRDTVSVIAVTPGSAAERAGVRKGDVILSAFNIPVPIGARGIADLDQQISTRFTAAPIPARRRTPNGTAFEMQATALPITVRRDNSSITAVIPTDTVCNYQVQVVKEDAVNAFADGQTIYITSAMMRFASDSELSTVISHELGHNVMKHTDAKKKNALFASLFGTVLDVAMATQGVNTGGRYTNEMAALGAQTFSQDFEREADYVGMYILAWAGEDYSHAADLWRHMATEIPGSIKFASSHPTTAERFVRLGHTVEEINAKKAANAPLMPEMKHE